MSDIESGNILVADHQGVHVIKMVGDVRLTLCIPFDDYIQSLFSKKDFCAILFDLNEVIGLDSTTLGLMAKLAVKSEQDKQVKPIIVGAQPGIERLLDMMGLNDVCDTLSVAPENYCAMPDFSPLDSSQESTNEELVRHKVLESHCVLMGLNEHNKETFKDLVQTLGKVS